MGSEVAPEFIYGHGLSYPAAANYYGYYCIGVEAPGKWDDHHNGFGLDGQDLHFSADGSQNVYYTSDYGYLQNSYNPYSHGSVVGFDGSLVGTQQYLADPTYHQPIPSPSYIPVPLSSSVDIVPHSRPESLAYTNYAYVPSKPDSDLVTVSNSVTSSIIPINSHMAVLSNLPLEYPPLVSRQFDASTKQSEAPAFNLLPLGQSLPYGTAPPGRLPYITQPQASNLIGPVRAAEPLVSGRVPSFEHLQNLKQSATNGLKHIVPDLHNSTPIDRLPSSFQSDSFSNGSSGTSLGQQDIGARTNRAGGQWTSKNITVKAYTSKVQIGNPQGTIIVSADQYNRHDFPVDYPCAKFFVIKSYSEDDVHKSIKYNVWSSTPNGNKKLNTAYEDAQRISAAKHVKCPVFLFFSVNGSGHFCGVAEMVGPVDFERDMDFWQQDKWTGSFPVKWHIIKDMPNTSIRQILLENNENKPVTHSRDTQEITHVPGSIMLKIFKISPLKESILDDFMKYEELENKNQKRKPNLLSYNAPIFVPSFVSERANIPSDRQSGAYIVREGGMMYNPQKLAEIQRGGYFNQSLQSDEQPPNHLANCSRRQNEKLPNGTTEMFQKNEGQVAKSSGQKESHLLAGQSTEGNGIRKAHTAVQQPKANGKPTLDASIQVQTHGKKENGTILQPAKADNNKSDKTMKRGDQKQLDVGILSETAGKASVNRIDASVQTDDKLEYKLDGEENLIAESGSALLHCRKSDSAACSNSAEEVVTIGSVCVRVKMPDA